MLDVVVLGAGQAGLSAAHHLLRRGLEPERDFVVLDANPGPGGAWRHRWPSLTFGGAHAIHDLPGMPLGEPDPAEPASAVVARYYGDYERRFGLPVHRPVAVRRVGSTTGDDAGPLRVTAEDGAWETRLLINGTGTWDRPYWPHYPGRELFRGRQLHTHDFRGAEEFRGQHVVVVGAGTSAVQFLLQLERAGATTTWSTRRPPQFTGRAFDAAWGRDVEHRVAERTRAGLPPLSVVATTGLPLTPEYRAGIEAGVLVSAGPLQALVPDGVVLAGGRHVRADAVLWATGFRASLDHLAPLRLREPGGGIRTDGVRVLRDRRVLLVGYGASASTLGATRAGRAAAREAVRLLAGSSVAAAR
ncbi:pyridine nucleotide-disulfide oxidoreductase [Kocuria flava]|uniref:Pyridine nucleotide-disulfide oxidoreductase n=1 Tax=Kocuria flava TaxID=446860 RepID=A0A2N4SZF1_9MICC|nr:NAD(P)-binding domain-containing protein [Kocuria flava]PLC11360.1 pyridine nucleotide-disulfide oxidoreductase [Kocuria flava]